MCYGNHVYHETVDFYTEAVGWKGYETMKKRLLSAAVLLLLILSIPVPVWADVIYPAPGDLVVGTPVNHLMATLDPGGTVTVNADMLPEGMYLTTEESEGGINVYLRGTPVNPGTYDCVIHYNESSSICTLHVIPAASPEPVLVSLSVETPPQQTQYTAGDTLIPDGLSIRAEMSDGSSVILTEGFELYPTRLEKAGIQTVEVSYGSALCYFAVDVAPAPEVIEGIGVLTLPEKVIYTVDETLYSQGLSIRVYTNNGTRDVSEGLVCSPILMTHAGSQTITVQYEGHTCSFTVQVLEPETPATLAVYHLPERLDYTVGDTLDSRGLVLLETGTRFSTTEIDSGFTCSPTHLTMAGSQEITVEYGDLRCSFTVNVREAESAPTTEPFPVPTATVTPTPVEPADTPLPSREPVRTAPQGANLVLIIAAAALIALGVLGVYVFVMNRNGEEFFAETLRELFRRRK